MRQDMNMPAIAKVLGVSVATLYRHLPPRPTALAQQTDAQGRPPQPAANDRRRPAQSRRRPHRPRDDDPNSAASA